MHKTLILMLAILGLGAAYAHGDDHAEHAHAAPASVVETAHAVPTLRAESEQFELVARLYEDELGLYIDHWASNAPLLNAQVEVELNGVKAIATFHADHGDYAMADHELLKALHAPGEHGLVFSIVDGKQADLLTGELQVEPAEKAGLAAPDKKLWAAAAVAALGVLLAAFLFKHRRKEIRL